MSEALQTDPPAKTRQRNNGQKQQRRARGKNRAPRTVSAKAAIASPPLAAGQQPRITPTPARQAAANQRALAASASAARTIGRAPPMLLATFCDTLPPVGEAVTFEDAQSCVEAFWANFKHSYRIKGSITLTAKAA